MMVKMKPMKFFFIVFFAGSEFLAFYFLMSPVYAVLKHHTSYSLCAQQWIKMKFNRSNSYCNSNMYPCRFLGQPS